jgi:uncharacterized GH25 family protein
VKNKLNKSIFLLAVIAVFSSHDLYLKMESYFLQSNQEATLSLYNGTFEKSENIITRDRMLDASFVAQGKRTAIQPALWKDQDSTITQLTFTTGADGTYVAGVSTKARNIKLTAKKFNDYLKHDGVLDMLARRTENNLLDQDAVESYEKHVKAIYQVGDVKTDDWKTVLDYPIEFVPLANPYEKYSGEKLEVQLLLNGKPLANQLVYAHHVHGSHEHAHDDHDNDHNEKEHAHDHEHDDHSHEHDGKEHSHDHDDEGKEHSHDHKHGDHKHDHNKDEGHSHDDGQQLLTNNQGIVTVDLAHDGIYYIRTIHMVNVTDSEELTHRSKWATLTFEVTHKHGDGTHTHDHEDGIPTWIFIVGSLLLIGILFFIFRKKN